MGEMIKDLWEKKERGCPMNKQGMYESYKSRKERMSLETKERNARISGIQEGTYESKRKKKGIYES